MRIPILFCIAAEILFAQAQLTVQNAAAANSYGGLVAGVRSQLTGRALLPQVAPGSLIRLSYFPGPNSPASLDFSTATVTVRSVESGQVFSAPAMGSEWFSNSGVAYVPREVPLGRADLVLNVHGNPVIGTRIEIVASSLQVFKRQGTADAQITRKDGTTARNGLTTPAHPGDFVTIWTTGLGTVQQKDVVVMLGGKPVAVAYAGPAPGLTGVDQINFQIPEDQEIPDACYLALRVFGQQTGDVTSITKTDTASACTHPLGLTTDAIVRLDAGGVVPVGSIQVGSIVTAGVATVEGDFLLGRVSSARSGFVRSESATAEFQRLDAVSVAARSGLAGLGNGAGGVLTGGFAAVISGLDAGTQLTLANATKSVILASSAFTAYTASLPLSIPTLDPNLVPDSVFPGGDWMLSGSGGKDIAPFAVPVHISPAIRLKKIPSAIDTKSDQVFEWDPAGYTDDDRISISISIALGLAPATGVIAPSLGVSVSVAARAGKAVIPASQFAEGHIDLQRPVDGFLGFSLDRGGRAKQLFTVQLRDGETAPVTVDYYSFESVPVQIR